MPGPVTDVTVQHLSRTLTLEAHHVPQHHTINILPNMPDIMPETPGAGASQDGMATGGGFRIFPTSADADWRVLASAPHGRKGWTVTVKVLAGSMQVTIWLATVSVVR